MVAMTPDKSYLMGILIGGGNYESRSISVEFPLGKWGSLKENPDRAGEIAQDLIQMLKPLFEQYYGLNISYKILKGKWIVHLSGDYSKLTSELDELGIKLNGSLRKEFPVGKLIPLLKDDLTKRRFVAGLADTIGSVAESHRRFTDEIQIVSFELSTFRFDNVILFCSLLHSLKCYPDQVLWNHPCMHSGSDKYYSGWKKGVKVRVTLDHYLAKESFLFKSKKTAAKDNLKKQESTHLTEPCKNRDCSFTTITSVHTQIDSKVLPEKIRGCIFCHHKQICAAEGCPYAPYALLDEQMKGIVNHITPFTLKTRGSNEEITNILHNDPILSKIAYHSYTYTFSELMKKCEDNSLLFAKGYTGYKSNIIKEGLHFLICASKGELNGLRPKGSQKDCFNDMQCTNSKAEFELLLPEKYSVLVLKYGKYSVMVGCLDPQLNEKLLIRDPSNKYLVKLKTPRVEDLTNAKTF